MTARIRHSEKVGTRPCIECGACCTESHAYVSKKDLERLEKETRSELLYNERTAITRLVGTVDQGVQNPSEHGPETSLTF